MTLFRVEAHDGKDWSFGIITPGASIPRFCSLQQADTGTQAEMEALKLKASRLVGGTLRVAEVPAADPYSYENVELSAFSFGCSEVSADA